LARYGMVRAFRRSDVQHAEMARWGRRLALGAGATGFLWGIAAIVVIDGEQELLHAFIAFVVAGMTQAFASQRAGVASIVIFLVLGFVLLLGVREERAEALD
ncbi:MAG: hypothetical protein QF391_07460, partial [Myxococcota bacterium]|nr:hypothetical protein [Myxococcota bacterium]